MSAYFVDALRYEMETGVGYRPTANARDGAPARLTYGFMNEVPEDPTSLKYGNPVWSFMRYNQGEKAEVARALASFEAVANVEFTLVQKGMDLNFGQFEMKDDIGGFANALYHATESDDLLVQSQIWLDSYIGVTQYHVIQHEIGHSLGLKHPFEDGPRLPRSEDKAENTLMSYTRDPDDEGLGLFDIIALQSIYGPARSRRNDNTHVFGEDKLIWDGGGEDRITAEDSGAAVSIDLRGGTWNHEGGEEKSLLRDGQVFLGYFTEIEHADGGRFDDRLIGNRLDNRLDGRDGADRLNGLGGADRIRGGDGADRLIGGTGSDTLSGAGGADTLEGGKGADDLRGGAGGDRFVFSLPSDSALARRDVLFDFARGEGDVIDLSALARKGSALEFIGGAAFSGAAGEMRFDHRAVEGTRLVLDADGDALPDFVLALEGRIALREADFVL